MSAVRFALLRGICQLPAYVAHTRGFLNERDVDSRVEISPTAWLIPEQLGTGLADFAVLPWTRVAAAEAGDVALKVLCGSGHEEAAIVVRHGVAIEDVRSVAVPREGGIKDLTALRLLDSLGWTRDRVEHRRFPSGDGAILCLVGQGADAASMVEPYAAMMEHLGIGRVVRRTGDVWPGAPGCSLAAGAALIERSPDLVQRVVDAYVAATAFVDEHPDEAAAIGAPFIGLDPVIVRRALDANRPRVDAVRSATTMRNVLEFMRELGYVRELPRDFLDLRFLDSSQGRTQDVRARA